MSRRRRPSSPSPESALPLEDDDLLDQIHLRLPPQPPYLLRASLVSKRWRRLATDPQFLRRFRIHHRKPPLLGEFWCAGGKILFRSALDPPYHIPPDRFSLGGVVDHHDKLLDCRHGRVLVVNRRSRQVVVWDPITGDRSFVAVPTEFGGKHSGAVLCAGGPFKLVLLSTYEIAGHGARAFVGVYSSETGIWSDRVSTALPDPREIYYSYGPGTLVGNTLYWSRRSILEFDLSRRSLAVIEKPEGVGHIVQIIRAEHGGVGLATLSCPRPYHPLLQVWEREVDSRGVAGWVLRKTVEIKKILGLRVRIGKHSSVLMRYVEDVHAIILRVRSSFFMVQLDSMQSRELSDLEHSYYPFTSFYTKGLEGILE